MNRFSRIEDVEEPLSPISHITHNHQQVNLCSQYRLTKSQQFVFKVTLVGSIGGLLFGYDMGVISQALPPLREDFNMSIQEQELLTSLFIVGGIVGCLIGGYVCDKYGRKMTMMNVSMVFIVGSLILCSASSLIELYIGRFIVGIGVTISAIADVSYLSEISPDKYRGAVVGCNELMITIGLLFAYFLDYFLSKITNGWRWMFAVPIFLSILWFIAMQFVPESPKWYLVQINNITLTTNNNNHNNNHNNQNNNHRNHDMNEKAVMIYTHRSDTEEEAQKEYERDKAVVEEMKLIEDTVNVVGLFKIWKYSIISSVALMLFQNWSGNLSVLTYSPYIFMTAGLGKNAAGVGAIILGIIKVAFTVLSMYLVDEVGRKRLLLTGVLGMIVSLTGIVIFVSTNINSDSSSSNNVNSSSSSNNSNDTSSSVSSIISIISVCSLVAFYSIGYGPLQWLITSELFAADIRGRALGLVNITSQLSALVAIASFLSLLNAVGPKVTFSMYLVMSIFAAVFIMLFIPETKRKLPSELLREQKVRYESCYERLLFKSARNRNSEVYIQLEPLVTTQHTPAVYSTAISHTNTSGTNINTNPPSPPPPPHHHHHDAYNSSSEHHIHDPDDISSNSGNQYHNSSSPTPSNRSHSNNNNNNNISSVLRQQQDGHTHQSHNQQYQQDNSPTTTTTTPEIETKANIIHDGDGDDDDKGRRIIDERYKNTSTVSIHHHHHHHHHHPSRNEDDVVIDVTTTATATSMTATLISTTATAATTPVTTALQEDCLNPILSLKS